MVGTNLAGLRHLQGKLEEQRGVEVCHISFFRCEIRIRWVK